MKHIINIVAMLTLLVGISSVGNAAWANGRTAEVRLVATINNSPAFQPVSWEVYRVDGTGEAHTSNRHTFTIDALPPGRYTAIARLPGHEARRRDFFITADTTNRVNIPLD